MRKSFSSWIIMRLWYLDRICHIVIIVELYTRYVSAWIELFLLTVNSVFFSRIYFIVYMAESIVWYPIDWYYWRIVKQGFILELFLVCYMLRYWRVTARALALLVRIDVINYLVFSFYWVKRNPLEIDAAALSYHLLRTLVNVTN